ncbi:hypothetical protein DEU56DRAFT_753231 [Suillus clintonianus]|uniref:uncharacterized protein n=1 Tax=Suillus clintonianus TaxID=1904413 RepID=UPI001B87A98A|nr:uncharacterized protein DEU56DRAFT_753231 [Suillus clintonianus]KAG2147969.1 hypothetical protein DEU56DRAFT_753231 [Suillus clintonianus]
MADLSHNNIHPDPKDDVVAVDATSPFSLDDVPVSQEEGAQGDGPTWEQTPVTNITLSALERIFCIKDRSSAIRLPNHHINIVLDSDLKLWSNNTKLLWKGSKHFLDFILVVLDPISLHAFLLKTITDHNFTLTLNLRLQSRQFSLKFATSKTSLLPTRAHYNNNNNYVMLLDAIPPAIIASACQFYNKDSLTKARLHGPHKTKWNITVFMPEVYQWMMFGITSLLKCIWEHQLPLLKLDKKPLPQMIEICAMLERALVYAYIGNILTYGLQHFEMCFLTSPGSRAKFHIQLSIYNPTPGVFMQYDQNIWHTTIITRV